ncbi:MAG: tRNA (adenosine(37)-N6)-dimethylallyltransferase MiaA [Cytophagales bacterium]|nr:tRNA (adenosine(37)-N6)-dimethylallyltransferase MiaA [Cytophaga sp.]
MSLKNKYLITVVGPTAVGKTALSVVLAKRYSTCVLSADSRQIYKELSIGTAKPGIEEQDGVKHYFIDTLSITEPFNAGMFERQALDLLETLFLQHDVVVACGGTGLYIKALLEGMDALPETDEELRAALKIEFERKGMDRMLEELREVDPAAVEQMDTHNPSRVFRALEVYRQTGIPISAFHTGQKAERLFKTVQIGLNMERNALYERINRRMDLMLDAGLEDEARSNIAFRHANALHTVGYSEIFGFIDGLYDREDMIRLLKRNSRRYAKRQLTWFGRDPKIRWFHPEQVEEIVGYIEKELV